MSSPRSVSTPMPPSPLRFSHTPESDVPIYDLRAAKIGEVCPIIGKEGLTPIDLIPMSGVMRLYRYGHLLSTQARMLKERDDYGQEVETPRTARSTCSIFSPPDHSYYTRVSKVEGDIAKDTTQTQTPITAHSTCSVFFPPATPGTGTKTEAKVDMGLKHSNNRPVKVKFFGYQREYPYTLDFQKMKNLNGYEKGMCSAPLYPSTLEKEAAFSQYFPESCCTPSTGYGKEHFDTTTTVDNTDANDKEHSDISSESEEDHSSTEGRSSTAPSVADSSNPTTPTSSTGSIPHIVVTPPQAKQTAIESPTDLSPAPKKKFKKPAAACGGYSIYKNSLPLRNWQASGSDSASSSSPPSDEQTSDNNKEHENDSSTTAATTSPANKENENENDNDNDKGKSKAKDDYHYVNYCNENWSQSKKDEFSRSLAMFYAQGRAQAATRKAMAWCEQQRSHNNTNTNTNTNASNQRQTSRREASKNMISLIARRIRGSETTTVPK